MPAPRGQKLQFEEAYVGDWDAFNARAAPPSAVTRAEVFEGLRRARHKRLVVRVGAHQYRLQGMNTVLLRPRRSAA